MADEKRRPNAAEKVEDEQKERHPRRVDGEAGNESVSEEVIDAIEGRAENGPPRRLREMLAMVGQWGPAPHPLADKISGEHITTMLDIDRERVVNQRDNDRHARITHAVMFGGFCGFVLLLVALLLWAGNDDLTEKILIGLVTAVASGFGGYGIGRSRKD